MNPRQRVPLFTRHLLAAALLLAVTMRVYAADCVFPYWRDTVVVNHTTRHLATADFNADGKMDLVGTDATSAFVALNQGSLTFSAPTTIYSGTPAAGIVAADIDGDGDIDIVLAERVTPSLLVFLNDGSGTFGSPLIVPLSLTPSRIAQGDFNGDGKPDIALFVDAPAQLAIYLGDGAGGFTQSSITTIADSPRTLTVGDLDHDGNLDIVVGHTYSSTLEVFYGAGDGLLPAPAIEIGRGSPNDAAIGDLNGDHFGDIVTVNSAEAHVAVLRNLGSRLFGYPLTYPFSGAYGIVVADVNGDSNPDAIVTTSGSIVTYPGFGDATLGTPQWQTSSINYSATYVDIVAADFDSDGRTDVAVAQADYYSPTGISIFQNLCGDSSVTLASSPVVSAGQSFDVTVKVGPPVSPYSWRVPVGTVTVKEGSTVIASGPLTDLGSVTFTIPGLAPTDHTFIASWEGDAQYRAKDSAPFLQHVTNDTTTTTLTANPTEGQYGQYIQFGGVVTTTDHLSPTGPIELWIDGNVANTLQAPQFNDTRMLTIGTHTVQARYIGDAKYPASRSAVLSFVYRKATLQVQVSPASSSAGTPITLYGNLLTAGYSSTPPTGSLTISEATTTLATVPLASYYSFNANIGSLPAGRHLLHLTYPGDDHYAPIDTYVTLTVFPAQGTFVDARGTASTITVTWFSSTLTNYNIKRMTPGGQWQYVGCCGSSSTWKDDYALPATVYLYRMESYDASVVSAADLGMKVSFTDDPVIAGMTIKTVHISEIVSALNIVRTAAGLTSVTLPDAGTGNPISAQQILTLQNAITEARASLGVIPFTFTTPIDINTPIRAAHIQELREAIR